MEFVRFWQMNRYTKSPANAAVKFGQLSVDGLFSGTTWEEDTLFYELVPVALPELEQMKEVSVCFHEASGEFLDEFTFLQSRSNTVDQLCVEVERLYAEKQQQQQQQGSVHGSSGRILRHRLLEVAHSRIHKVLRGDTTVEDLPPLGWGGFELRVERCPPEEGVLTEMEMDHQQHQQQHYHGSGGGLTRDKAAMSCDGSKEREATLVGGAGGGQEGSGSMLVCVSHCERRKGEALEGSLGGGGGGFFSGSSTMGEEKENGGVNMSKTSSTNNATIAAPLTSWGEPLMVVVHRGDQPSDLRSKILAQLKIKETAGTKAWPLHLNHKGHYHASPLEDRTGTDVMDVLGHLDLYDHISTFIGIEHPDERPPSKRREKHRAARSGRGMGSSGISIR